jgi:hypothetical protein
MKTYWKKLLLSMVLATLAPIHGSYGMDNQEEATNNPFRSIYRFDDPRLLEITVEECGEPLVKAEDYGIPSLSSFERRSLNANQSSAPIKIRKSVAEKLQQAQGMLNDRTERMHLDPMQICIIGGYCPPILIHEEFEQKITEDPNFPKKKQEAWDNVAWNHAPLTTIDGKPLVAPRATGGVVSLGVWTNPFHKNISAMTCDFGLSFSNKSTWRTDYHHPDGTIHQIRTAFINILQETGMVNAGFIHRWSYGDPYSALIKGEKTAIYGVVNS